MKDQMPLLIQGDARALPLPDESVDLVVTSPPYFGLRSYSDGGEHYGTQIGAEPTPQEFLDALIECTAEMMRVLKPSGSIWVNLGDRYVADNRGSGSDVKRGKTKHAPSGPAGFVGLDMARQKSLMLLPRRYAIRCSDELGLIVRQDQVWSKTNGLPESVADRTRRSHEYLFHLVKQTTYYSSIDCIRESYSDATESRYKFGYNRDKTSVLGQTNNSVLRRDENGPKEINQFGKLPGSVWNISTQPLNIPDHVAHSRCCDGRKSEGCEDNLDHYAAFPFALVRPIILGWCPRDVCLACGEGRRPRTVRDRPSYDRGRADVGAGRRIQRLGTTSGLRSNAHAGEYPSPRVIGYTCGCPDPTAPSTPGVVLDPFGGTGSAALVAAMNGRIGISVDASWDYCDVLARWRVNDSKERARAAGLDPDAVARIPVVSADQGSLWDTLGGVS